MTGCDMREEIVIDGLSARPSAHQTPGAPIICHLAHADLADRVHYVLALRDQKSICRNFCSVLLDVKDIPQVGPLQWGESSASGSVSPSPAFFRGWASGCSEKWKGASPI